MNCLELQSPEEIEDLYILFNKNLLRYNNIFFHFSENNLKKYLRNPDSSKKYRFNKFKRNWENFNNHKQILYHFFKHNTISYPNIFDTQERIIIKRININFNDILSEINVLKIKEQSIPYIYKKIIENLIKTILTKYLVVNCTLRNIISRYT